LCSCAISTPRTPTSTLFPYTTLFRSPEFYDTLEENASIKSQTIFRLTGKSCFSEDTGLEVDALNGEPGVRSARYAGEDANHAARSEEHTSELQSRENLVCRLLLENTK